MNQRSNRADNLRSDDRIVDNATVELLFNRILTPPGWMEKAACVRHDRRHDSTLDVVDDTETMTELCASCPVYDRCSLWADTHDVHYGVYAGCDMQHATSRYDMRQENDESKE